MRRRAVVAITAGLLLLLLPSAALGDEVTAPDQVGIGGAEAVEAVEGDAPAEVDAPAPADEPAATEAPARETAQEPSDEVGIGRPASVECRGTIRADVVDLDGAPVGGALLSVAGQQLTGPGTVETGCGSVAASLLAAPDGYALAGPETLSVQVRQAAVTGVTFTVDPVEVLGVQLERPAPPAAPDTAVDADAVVDLGATDGAPAELAATGPADAPTLLLAALVLALLGVVLVAATPAAARPARG